LVQYWYNLHRRSRLVRWPLKTTLFVLVVAAVLYPKPWLVPSWCARLRDMNTVIDPTDSHLARLQDELLRSADTRPSLPQLRPKLERAVYDAVPYAFDWETWGVMDYLPTVGEVFALGCEDCDGRAVVAASLLRRMGYQADLATDLKHTWVVARDPARPDIAVGFMAPGEGPSMLVRDAQGRLRLRVSADALSNLGRGLAYGIAVFPLERELIILAALCLVLLHPWITRRRWLAGCMLLAAALVLLRLAGAAPRGLAAHPALVWIALAGVVCGCVVLAIKQRHGATPVTRSPRSQS
jgi:hypothetical protein